MLRSDAVLSVVDDDESVRKSLQRLLKSMGFKVKTFPTAREFLSYGHYSDYGCMIIDVRMPGINGLDLHKQLVLDGCDVPVIFITAHEDEAVRVRAMEGGAWAFLQKPFSAQSLLTAVSSALDQTCNEASAPDVAVT